jgi:hypothetical protein
MPKKDEKNDLLRKDTRARRRRVQVVSADDDQFY